MTDELGAARTRIRMLEEALEQIAADFIDFPQAQHAIKLGIASWRSMAVEQQSIARRALAQWDRSPKGGDHEGGSIEDESPVPEGNAP